MSGAGCSGQNFRWRRNFFHHFSLFVSGEASENITRVIHSPHLISSQGQLLPSALIPFCALNSDLGVLGNPLNLTEKLRLQQVPARCLRRSALLLNLSRSSENKSIQRKSDTWTDNDSWPWFGHNWSIDGKKKILPPVTAISGVFSGSIFSEVVAARLSFFSLIKVKTFFNNKFPKFYKLISKHSC